MSNNNEATAPRSKFLSIGLLLIGLLLGWLVQYLTEKKTPVPTFKVNRERVEVIPDRTLGADKVKISVFGVSNNLLVSGLIPVDSSFFIQVPATDRRSIRVLQEYLCESCLVFCCDNEVVLEPDDTGVPIVSSDVIMRQNTTPPPAGTDPASNWCECTWGTPSTVSIQSDGVGMFTWGTTGSTNPDVRSVTVTNGSNNVTVYIRTLGNNEDYAQYSTSANFNCLTPTTLTQFTYLDASHTPTATQTARVRYTDGTTTFTLHSYKYAGTSRHVKIYCSPSYTVTQSQATGCSNNAE